MSNRFHTIYNVKNRVRKFYILQWLIPMVRQMSGLKIVRACDISLLKRHHISFMLTFMLTFNIVYNTFAKDFSDSERVQSKVLKQEFVTKIKELEDNSYFREKLDNFHLLKGKDAKKCLADLNQVLSIQYELKFLSFSGAERALKDVIKNFPEESMYAQEYLDKIDGVGDKLKALKPRLYRNDKIAISDIKRILKEHRKVLVKNPVFSNLEIYAVRQVLANARNANAADIGRNRNNWSVNASMRKTGWNNEICKLSNLQDEIISEAVFKPANAVPVKDVDLHWSGEKMLFSSVGENNRWHVYEMNIQTGAIQNLTASEFEDIDFFDACYLPDGRIILASTASYAGVPCVGGKLPTSDLYLFDKGDRSIRQLTFGQDCVWNPVIMNDGKVCYLRWEYTDNSHYFTRILMHMNPDGTTKKELYGSGSYFPNALFDSRPIPGRKNQFIGIVSGHHGVARAGRLLIFDPKKGRKEADGVVQEIPGFGKKVKPIIKDRLVDGVWPQFLTPYPINENYFLVAAKLGPEDLWGIYLVDRFDNIVLFHEAEGEAYTEPIIIRKNEIPPVIPDRIIPGDTMSTVYIADIYEGTGLQNIPRGNIKNLRIYAYQYSYNNVGGHDYIACEGGWDVKRILGTVPVEEDGSAMFKIPANTPVSLQPLDGEGAAMQLMRSWMTGMPGEIVSCVGCHESQNSVPPVRFTTASRNKPAEITPWYGPTRPVAYNTELKPVIDKKCVGCHDGSNPALPDFADNTPGYHGFSASYMALHPYVRRPGCESDFHTLEPMDYHVNTSELVQMLKKGHYNVKLDAEEWDRLITWIDMNVPFHGRYTPPEHNGYYQPERRNMFLNLYGNVSLTGEEEFEDALNRLKEKEPIQPVMPEKRENPVENIKLPGWPLNKEDAVALQKKFAVNGQITKIVELTDGINLAFVRIPAGKFVFGNNYGQPDQRERVVEIEEPFWMSKTEITNAMVRIIFENHDSRFIDQQWKDHVYAGYPANEDHMPAIRITWEKAREYCEKLSAKTGLIIDLPTEEQWEWAARAGSDTEMYFGKPDDDFSAYENLADYTLRDLAVAGVNPRPMNPNHPRFEVYNFVPKEEKYNDGILTPQGTGQYKPNAWGLHDMLGNVAEWTRSDYNFYGKDKNLKVARGGSWRDRPKYSTSATRDGYYSFQKVFNVGFRLVIQD